jgi:NAD(P)-dependent dehydrogenase (short-subunit alcohol dehydrogenase family)
VAGDPGEIFSLAGKTAVVVGASSGLGARFAQVLAAAGAKVVVGARREDRLSELVERIVASGGEAIAASCDVTDEASVEDLADTAVGELGSLDVMVACAGVAPQDYDEPESAESFRKVMDVNATGAWLCAASAYRRMKGAGGSVILISSISGLLAGDGPDSPSYTASKGAVVNLTRELGVRWAPESIRVNSIAPGWFHSEMTETDLSSPSGLEFVESRTPLGRVGAEDELDGALVFLASEASSYVTGHTLVVDGGWTAR